MADAAGEQFHQFAGEVLVGVLLGVGLAIEIDQHRRVAGDGQHQVAEAAIGQAANGFDLPVHQVAVFDLE